LLEDYPDPSPAAEAATVANKVFLASSSNPQKAMLEANEAVAKLNEGRTVDYLANDFAGCVFVGCTVRGETLYWASIGDCFVAVFDSSGKMTFISPDGVKHWREYEWGNQGNWEKPERRKEVRQRYRNNPDEPVAYGALTGEQSTEHFIESGERTLQAGDLICCFSDGFHPTILHPDFFGQLQEGDEAFRSWSTKLAAKDYGRYGHERTLLIAAVE
jgi:hypothetical protein